MFSRAVKRAAKLWLKFSGAAASEKKYNLWALARGRRREIADAETELERRDSSAPKRSAPKPKGGGGGAHAE